MSNDNVSNSVAVEEDQGERGLSGPGESDDMKSLVFFLIMIYAM